MMADSIRAELQRELGGEDQGILAALSEAQQSALLDAIRETRRRQKRVLDDAVNEGMRLVPALLRGTLKRILFP